MFYWALLASGFTSAFNCVALQMGLLGSTIASRHKDAAIGIEGKRSAYAAWATGTFLVSKLLAYTLLGALLGLFGKAFSISDGFSTIVELIAGSYVVLAALAVLDIHPFFRYFIIQPPRFMARFVTKASKKGDLLTPAFLGVLTILIPCGTTVAVEALALHHANLILSGMVLGLFTLGTMPVYIAFGGLAGFARSRWGKGFDKVSALIVLFLGLWALKQSLGEILR